MITLSSIASPWNILPYLAVHILSVENTSILVSTCPVSYIRNWSPWVVVLNCSGISISCTNVGIGMWVSIFFAIFLIAQCIFCTSGSTNLPHFRCQDLMWSCKGFLITFHSSRKGWGGVGVSAQRGKIQGGKWPRGKVWGEITAGKWQGGGGGVE